ncbi:hypothetical protein WL86_25870 [Burkholderia diffusa]|nr:hypothetical protein WL86_25870 [Burkholderia diffusa]
MDDVTFLFAGQRDHATGRQSAWPGTDTHPRRTRITMSPLFRPGSFECVTASMNRTHRLATPTLPAERACCAA